MAHFIPIFILIVGLIVCFSIAATKQEITPLNQPSCDVLNDCVDLQISCINTKVHNNLLGIKWDFEQNMNLGEQKALYKRICLNLEDEK